MASRAAASVLAQAGLPDGRGHDTAGTTIGTLACLRLITANTPISRTAYLLRHQVRGQRRPAPGNGLGHWVVLGEIAQDRLVGRPQICESLVSLHPADAVDPAFARLPALRDQLGRMAACSRREPEPRVAYPRVGNMPSPPEETELRALNIMLDSVRLKVVQA